MLSLSVFYTKAGIFALALIVWLRSSNGGLLFLKGRCNNNTSGTVPVAYASSKARFEYEQKSYWHTSY